MSCANGKPNWRLLDVNVGWSVDAASTVNISGFSDPQGIYLSQAVAGAIDPNAVLQYLLPARLARGCGDCKWFLITPAAPESLLLSHDNCHAGWGCANFIPGVYTTYRNAVSVAAWRHFVGVANAGNDQVLLHPISGTQPPVVFPLQGPGPLAFTPRGELVATSTASDRIAVFSPGGGRDLLKAPAPSPGRIDIIAVDAQSRVWIVLDQAGSWTLWRAAWDDAAFTQAPVTDLASAFPKNGLAAVSSEGFCFDQDTRRGLQSTTCFSWFGRPMTSPVAASPLPARQTHGQLITLPLDSGIPRCEWHRVRIDADVPAGATLSVAVAATEDGNPAHQGDSSREPDPAWRTFPPGPPHFSDWTSAPTGSLDFLIDQPTGRYLFLRLRLTGNAIATPVVRRIRIDFPRVTSLDRLPNVYRQDPKAEDFTKRFLALFDASIAEVDDVIQRYPALLDSSGVPEQLLPWLGGFFDITLDPTWSPDQRRRILQSAPQLYRLRGTAAGLELALQLVFGITPAIEQSSSAGPWGALARQASCRAAGSAATGGRPAYVGGVRLFGRKRTRFWLGRSALGLAPLRSYGNPDRDPFATGAFRFRVLTPPLADSSPQQIQRLQNLIASQSPAHAVASVRIGGTGFLAGVWSAVGIDTAFVPLSAPVLGSDGNVRLNRMSVLWTRSGGDQGSGLGRNSIVGTQVIGG